MKSLFAKILLWFLGTLIVCLVAFVATSVSLSINSPGPPDLIAHTISMQLDQAREAFEKGGPERLNYFLRRLGRHFPADHYLVDVRGRDMVDGTDRSRLLAHAVMIHHPGLQRRWPTHRHSKSRTPSFLALGLLPRRSPPVLAGESADSRYRLIAVVKPRPDPWGFVPYYLWILLLMALLSYTLAVHLASPLRSLRQTVERFGQGDLSARSHTTRKDEIGALARDFDRMAERIETLLNAERRLLQDVSHELRSPLARLGFAVELARTSHDREASLARIEKDIHRLAVLVDELLYLTRAEGDPSSCKRETIVLHEFVAAIVEDCSVEAEPRDCRLLFRAEQAATLQGDEELLHRAIENVVRNAIRHAPEGTRVEVGIRANHTSALITVRDHGSGVPSEALEAIFYPFFRVDAHRDRASGGAGLGLSIAQRAVELHNGRLWAENAGPGLKVTIELPLGYEAVESRV